MPFTVSIERSPQLVRFRVAGPASLKNYFDLVEDAARETLPRAETHVLVDLRGVIGRLKFTDQFFIGEIVGQKLRHLHKLASLVPTDPTSYNSETVAHRNGVNLRMFEEEAKALAWLAQVEVAHSATGSPK